MTFCWHVYTQWSHIVLTKSRDLLQYKQCIKCKKIKVRFL